MEDKSKRVNDPAKAEAMAYSSMAGRPAAEHYKKSLGGQHPLVESLETRSDLREEVEGIIYVLKINFEEIPTEAIDEIKGVLKRYNLKSA